ncbi:MAG: HEAT repeat domain-containing protein, partial [Thermomicrobiales bacterium]
KKRNIHRREEYYADAVFGTLIEAPTHADFGQLRSSGLSRVLGTRAVVFQDETFRLRPGDSAVLERMFLRLAVELKGTDRVRVSAICEDAGFVDGRVRQLHSRRWWVRLAAAQKLGVMRSGRATLPLTEALNDRNRDVRLGALRSLASIGDPASYEDVLAAMRDEMKWESSVISEIVLTLGTPICLPILERMRSTPELILTAGYVKSLGLLREHAAVVSLLPLLEDNEHLRLEAIHALGHIGDGRVVPGLVSYLCDPLPEIRAATAEALGRLQEPCVIVGLRGLLSDHDRSVRYASAVALTKLDCPGLRMLKDIEYDNEPLAQGIAQQVLAEHRIGLH